MKRLFVLSLVAVLSVGLLSVGAFAQVNTEGSDQMEDSAIVSWSYSGVVQCQVNLNVHGNVNLGEIETVNNTMTSNSVPVVTESNCAYNLSVEAIETAAPSDFSDDVLEDFQLELANWSGSITSADLTGWNNLDQGDSSSTVGGNAKTVGSWNGNSTGNMSSATWDMRYRYTTDNQDANGDYSVTLQYTVANQ